MPPQTPTLEQFVSQVAYLRDALNPDMTGLAMAIFAEVARHPFDEGVPMSRIVQKFGLSAATASRNVYLLSSGLVRPNESRRGMGVIRTDTSPVDRRALQVYLTPKGRELAKAFMQVK
jgi:DNA-binding MarR family transcriptional regulator